MNFITNKEKGNTSLGIAIAYYTSNGYTVSIPLNDTQDYDLLVDKNNIIKKVQVKSTGCKTKYGNYQVALKSCGGTKGNTYKTVVETNIDELFILTEDLRMYILPKEEIHNKSTLNICDKYVKYRVK
ncbi:MAG: group I intron-associated PD-(D/E)XK endonuclease [Clostridia bacterium]